MRRQYRWLSLFLTVGLLFTAGCGTNRTQEEKITQEQTKAGEEATQEQTTEQEEATQEQSGATQEQSGATEEDTTAGESAEGSDESNETPVNEDIDTLTQEEEVGLLNIEKVRFTAKKPLEYNGWIMEVLGLEEKEKIVTETYTDQAADGKVYLILYLKMRNMTDSDYYFAPELLNTKVDGQTVETTYLVNSPHSYDTLYRTYESGELSAGFLVWEVPKNWQKLKMTYHGFEIDNYMTPILTLTPADLSEPDEYDPVYLT